MSCGSDSFASADESYRASSDSLNQVVPLDLSDRGELFSLSNQLPVLLSDNALKLPAIWSSHLGLLSEAEWEDFAGAEGILHCVGEVFAVLLNHQHRFEFFSHFDSHFRCTRGGLLFLLSQSHHAHGWLACRGLQTPCYLDWNFQWEPGWAEQQMCRSCRWNVSPDTRRVHVKMLLGIIQNPTKSLQINTEFKQYLYFRQELKLPFIWQIFITWGLLFLFKILKILLTGTHTESILRQTCRQQMLRQSSAVLCWYEKAFHLFKLQACSVTRNTDT